jgi:hypothetical protein
LKLEKGRKMGNPEIVPMQQDRDAVDDRRNRLPSFAEVLSPRTRPPVDLFMF